MSDSPEGPGWWQASDGKWYPPEQAPGAQPAAAGAVAPGQVDIGQAFQWAWAKYTANVQPLLILGCVVAGVPLVIAIVGLFISSFLLSTFFALLSLIVGFVLSYLTVQAGLTVANTGTINQSEMFKIGPNFGTFAITAILFGILAFLGCLVFCVGLLVVYFLFGLWGFVVLDEGKSPIEALTRSKDLVLGPGFGVTFVPMLVFLIFSAGGGFLGFGARYAVIVGIFLAPFGAVLGAYIFKSLKGEPVAA